MWDTTLAVPYKYQLMKPPIFFTACLISQVSALSKTNDNDFKKAKHIRRDPDAPSLQAFAWKSLVI